MMTPKEKAQELLFQFSHANSCVKSAKNVPVGLILMRNKLCALIAVDEILLLLPLVNRDFWQEVKQEIANL